MSKSYITLFILFVSIITLSCTKKVDQKSEVITINNTRPINELKDLVLKKGDTIAYDELGTAFLNEKHEEEYLVYSLIMANKYKYKSAYYYVYDCLLLPFDRDKIEVDEKTKALALEYLLKGVELNEHQAMSALGDLYMTGTYVPKDTLKGQSLIHKSWE